MLNLFHSQGLFPWMRRSCPSVDDIRKPLRLQLFRISCILCTFFVHHGDDHFHLREGIVALPRSIAVNLTLGYEFVICKKV